MTKQVQYKIGFSADTSEAESSLKKLETSLKRISTIHLDSFMDDASLESAAKAAQDLQAHLHKAVNADTGKLNLNAFNASLRQSNQSVTSLANDLLNAGNMGSRAFMQLAQSIAAAEVPIKKVNSTLASIGQTLKNTVKWELSSSFVHGIEGALSNAVGYIKNLNSSLTDIRIVTGASVDEMARFAQQANIAAKSLSTTTKAYADASLIYYQQGDSAEQVAKKAAITIKAANSSFNTSAAEMSEYLTAVWNSYQVGADELERYVDIMAALGAKTATSLEEIATSMQKVAATANTVGVSMEQVSSIISTVSSVTRESAESIGTSYKTIFARIGDLKLGGTTEDGLGLGQVSSALESIGVEILDSSNNLRDMGDIINDLGTKWQTMSEAQKTATAQVVAGKRQYTQLMALFENWDMYQANMNIAQNAEGSLQKMADIQAESWEAASARVTAALESIYSSLLNDQSMIKMLGTVELLVEGVDGLIKGLGGLPGIIGTVGGALGNAFAPEIAAGITSLGVKIKDIFTNNNSEQQKFLETNRQMRAELAALAQDSAVLGPGQQTEIQGLVQVSAAKDRLIQSSKNLSSAQVAEIESAINGYQQEIERIAQLQQVMDKVAADRTKQSANLQNIILEDDLDALALERTAKENAIEYREIAFNLVNEATLSDAKPLQIEPEISEDSLQKYAQSCNKEIGKIKENFSTIQGALNEVFGEGNAPDTITSLFEKSETFVTSLSDAAGLGQYLQQVFIDTGSALKNSSASTEDIKNDLEKTLKSAQQIAANLGMSFSQEFKIPVNLDTAEGKREAQEMAVALQTELNNMIKTSEPRAAALRAVLTKITPPEHKAEMDSLWESWSKGSITLQDLEERAKKLGINFEEVIKKMTQSAESLPQKLVKLGSGITSLVSMFNSLSNAWDAIKNPEMSGWQKFMAVLGGVSSVLMGLQSVMDAGKVLKGAYNAIMAIGIGLEMADAAAKRDSAEAQKEKNLAELKAIGIEAVENGTKKYSQEAFKAGAGKILSTAGSAIAKIAPWVAAAAAIAAVGVATYSLVTAEERYKKALEERSRALEAASKKNQMEIQSLISDTASLASIMSDTTLTYDEQISKINEIAAAYGIQATAVDALTGSYGRFMGQLLAVTKTEASEKVATAQEHVTQAQVNMLSALLGYSVYDYETYVKNTKEAFGDDHPLTSIEDYYRTQFGTEYSSTAEAFTAEQNKIVWSNILNDMPKNARNSLIADEVWLAQNTDNLDVLLKRDAIKLSKEGDTWSNNSDFLTALDNLGFSFDTTTYDLDEKEDANPNYIGLYKLLTEYDALSENRANQDDFSSLLIETLDQAQIGTYLKMQQQLWNAKAFESLWDNTDFINMAFNTDGRTASIQDLSKLIANVNPENFAATQSLLETISQYSAYQESGESLSALYSLVGKAVDANLTMDLAGTDAQEERKQQLIQTLADEFSDLSLETILHLSITDIDVDNGSLKEGIKEYIDAIDAVAKNQGIQTALKDNKDLLLQDTFTDQDYQTLLDLEASKKLGDSFDAESFAKSSAATRAAIVDKLNDEAIAAETEALKLYAEQADIRAKNFFEAFQNAENEFNKNRVKGEQYIDIQAQIAKDTATRDALQKAINEYEQNTDQQEDFDWSSYGVKNYDEAQTSLAGLNTEIEKQTELIANVTEAETIWRDASSQAEKAQKELTGNTFQEEWTKKIEKATEASNAFSQAIQKQGELTAEELAILSKYDDNIIDNYENMSNTEWMQHSLDMAVQYYNELEQLYQNDANMQAQIRQDREKAEQVLYEQLSEQAKQAAEKQKEEWKKITDAAQSAMQNASNLIGGEITFANIEQLKQDLADAGIEAEHLQKVLHNLTDPETEDPEKIKAAAALATTAALQKIGSLQEQSQQYAQFTAVIKEVKQPEPTPEIGVNAQLDEVAQPDEKPEIPTDGQLDEVAPPSETPIVEANASLTDATQAGEFTVDAIGNIYDANSGDKIFDVNANALIINSDSGADKVFNVAAIAEIAGTLPTDTPYTITVQGAVNGVTQKEVFNVTVDGTMMTVTPGKDASSFVVDTYGNIVSVVADGEKSAGFTIDLKGNVTALTQVTAEDLINSEELSEDAKEAISNASAAGVFDDKQLFIDVNAKVRTVYALDPETGEGFTIDVNGKVDKILPLTEEQQKNGLSVNIGANYTVNSGGELLEDQEITVKVNYENETDALRLSEWRRKLYGEQLSEEQYQNAKKVTLEDDLNNLKADNSKWKFLFMSGSNKDAVGHNVEQIAMLDQLVGQISEVDWDNLQQNTADGINRLIQFIVDMCNSSDDKTREAGIMLLRGLEVGLADEAGSVDWLSTIDGLGADIVTDFMTELEIHSPSGLTIPLGKFLIEGLKVGIAEAAADFDTPLDGLAEVITNDFTELLKEATSGIDTKNMDIFSFFKEIENDNPLAKYRSLIALYDDEEAAADALSEAYKVDWVNGEYLTSDKLTHLKKAILTEAIGYAKEKLEIVGDINEENLELMNEKIQEYFNNEGKELMISVSQTWSEVKGIWETSLSDLFTNEESIAEQTYDLWESTFAAIAEARQGLLSGKSIAESMFGDEDKMSKIVAQMIANGKDLAEINTILMDKNADLSQLVFTPFEQSEWRNAGQQRWFNYNADGSLKDTSYEQYKTNLQQGIEQRIDTDLQDILTTSVEALSKSDTQASKLALKYMQDKGLVDQIDGAWTVKDGATISDTDVAKELAEKLTAGMQLSEDEFIQLYGIAIAKQLGSRMQLADYAEKENQTIQTQNKEDLAIVSKARKALLEGEDLKSVLNESEAERLKTLTGTTDLAAVSLNSLDSATITLTNTMLNAAASLASIIPGLQNGSITSYSLNKDGTIEGLRTDIDQREIGAAIAKANNVAFANITDDNIVKLYDEWGQQIAELTKEESESAITNAHTQLAQLTTDTSVQNKLLGDLDPDAMQSLWQEYADGVGYAKDEFQNYAQMLYEASGAQGQLQQQTNEIQNQYMQLAENLISIEQAWTDLTESQSSNIETLKQGRKGTGDYTKALNSLTKTVKKVFGGAEKVTEKFVESHLEDIEKMAKGDEEALERVEDALISDILGQDYNIKVKVDLDKDGIDDAVGDVIDSFNDLEVTLGGVTQKLSEIQEGSLITPQIDTSGATQSLLNLVAAGGETADAITAALAAIGWVPEIEYVEVPFTDKQIVDGDVIYSYMDSATGQITTYNGGAHGLNESNGMIKIPKIGNGNVSGGLRKTGAGSSSTRSSSGNGGGGGGKPKTIDTKNVNDEKDRYHEITQRLERMAQLLDKVSKYKDRAFGKSYLKNLESEIKLLKQQEGMYERKLQEAKDWLDFDKNRLAEFGVTYDEMGNINNYDEVMEAAVAEYNAFVARYNAMSAEAQKASDENEEQQEAEEKLENLKEYISDYEESLNNIYDLQNDILEVQNKQSELALEAIQYKVEYQVEINEDDIELLEYFDKKWEEAIDKQDDRLAGMIENSNKLQDNLALLATEQQELNDAYAQGDINLADYVEGLRQVKDDIMENLEALREIQDTIEELYGETLDLISEKVEEQTDHIDAATEAMGSYITILGLMGRGKNFRELETFYEKQVEYSLESAKAQRQHLDLLLEEKEYYDNIINSGQELNETEQIWYQDLLTAIDEANSELLSTTEEVLNNIAAEYENTIKAIFKELDDLMGGAKDSIASLSDAYSYYTETQERYVTSAKELYEVSKLTREIEESIEDTTTTANKQMLTALKERINAQSELNQLTEYDIEMNRLQYELALAKINLEDAANAKDTVRLTRDESGNYVYQYTANTDKINEAKQEYEDVLQQINELAYNRTTELEQMFLDAQQEYFDAAQEIANDTTLTVEERTVKLNELYARYCETQQYIQEQYHNATGDLMTSNTTIAQHYNDTLTAQAMNSRDNINETIAGMIEDNQTYRDAFLDTITQINDAQTEQQSKLDYVASEALVDYGNMIAEVERYDQAVENAGNKVDEVLGDGSETKGMLTQIKELGSAWGDFAKILDETVIPQFEDLLQDIIDTIRELANLEDAVNSADLTPPNTGGSSTTTTTTTTTNTNNSSGDGGGKGGESTLYKATYNSLMGGGTIWGKATEAAARQAALDKIDADSATWRANNPGAPQAGIGQAIQAWKAGISVSSYVYKYKTGGLADFTGPAWLDGTASKPELVLNATDTQNMLAAVGTLRELDTDTIALLVDTLNAATSSLFSALAGNYHASGVTNASSQEINQNVEIHADFPNVTDRNEIVEAIDDLVNRAAQFAQKKMW